MRNRKVRIFPWGDLTGGEAHIYPISAMPPKYSTLLQNFHITEKGGIGKIPGYTKVNSTTVSSELTYGYEFRKSNGTVITLVAGGGKIYKVDGGSLTAIKTGLDTSAIVDFAQMNDICIMVNGVDAPMKYDGTTVSALGGSPPATAYKVHVHKRRVWMLEKADRVKATHSALNNPEDYTTGGDAGYIDFAFVIGRGDEALDVKTYVDLIVFFFRSHIVIYSGTNPTASGDFAIVQVIEGSGVVASNAAIGAGTNMAFIYKSGIKTLRQVVTTGSLNADDLSDKIDPVLRDMIAAAGTFNVAHYPKNGWLLFQIGETVWIYSYTWKAWGRMVGADVKGMFHTTDGKVYICGTGFLYEFGTGDDFAGVSPKYIWCSAYKRFSKGGHKVYPKAMTIVSQPYSDLAAMNLYVTYDMNNPSSEYPIPVSLVPEGIVWIDAVTDWDAIDPFDEVQYGENRVPLFGAGRSMTLTLEDNSKESADIVDLTVLAEVGGF